jgi:hypothetical protein
MKDGFGSRYDNREPGSNVIPLSSAEAHNDLGPCGLLRGLQDRSLMLELRMRDGRILACGYTWLDNAAFVPWEGITLCFARQRIRITGQNLDAEIRPGVRLFDALLRHRVVWLREADAPCNAATGEVVIERIDVDDPIAA